MNATTLSGTETTAPPLTMHTLLTGRKALVTGANSGTKEACAALMTPAPYGQLGSRRTSRAVWLAPEHSEHVVGTTV